MNDPNGLIRVDGVWHLFFQHDPDSTRHGPMHWGHASSTDLLHWQEQPVALAPTPLGTCFSGSAVETAAGEVKLFYTAHSRTAAGEDFQVQCLVHADLAHDRFIADPGNPVIDNPGLHVFRDPKVIWHAPSARWIMLLTEGQSVGFYASDDLTEWTHLSSFGAGDGRHSAGPWECPDLVPLAAPDGRLYWVLLIGLNPGSYALGSGTQYFIGQFDGTRFHNSNPPPTELWLDYGRDYYAAQTFFVRGGTEPPVAIAWASNWLYAQHTPTAAFRGVMTLPRELRLVDTADGLRVAARVPAAVAAAYDAALAPGVERIAFSTSPPIGTETSVTLFGAATPQLSLRRDGTNSWRLRTVRAALPGLPEFGHDYEVAFTWPSSEPLDVTLFIDRGLVELSLADGLVSVTNLYFPDDPAAPAIIHRPAGDEVLG